jgi:hypothetical protein
MIRRGFWLTAGAVTGIYGYRRVSAIGRRLSASLTPGTRLAPEAGPRAGQAFSVRQARRGAVRLARETHCFTRDVREGMELYRLAHSAPAGSTLSTDRSTDHDVQPEDGH